MTVRGLTMTSAARHLPPHSRQPTQNRRPKRVTEADAHGIFKDLQLMAQCENLELQGRERTPQSRSVVRRALKTDIAQEATHRRC